MIVTEYYGNNDWRDCCLVHYGISGMEWGKRNGPPYPLTGSQKSAEERKAERLENRQIKKSRKDDLKNRRRLSDVDLNKKIERLRKEKQLKDLTKEDIAPGKKAIKDTLSSTGKKVAAATLTGVGIYAAKKVIEQLLGKDVADMVRLPKK